VQPVPCGGLASYAAGSLTDKQVCRV